VAGVAKGLALLPGARKMGVGGWLSILHNTADSSEKAPIGPTGAR
jgi:hypothetical protein